MTCGGSSGSGGNISATSDTNVSSAILSIQERGIDFQRERFLIRLSTDFCEHILRMSVESLWRNEYSFYLVDFQYSLIQISMLEFLESLEFIEF
jgi:hypothetical protein